MTLSCPPFLTSGRVGLVLGATALTVSLGVPGYAASMINGKDIKNGTVGTSKLANGAVSTPKLKTGAVTSPKIKNDTVTGADVKESTLKGLLRTGQVAAFGAAETGYVDDFTTATFTPLVTKTFTAPAAGVLYVTGSISAEDDSSLAGLGNLLYRLSLDGVGFGPNDYDHELDFADSGDGDSGAVTGVVPVSAGTHTVALNAKEGGSGTYIQGREVSVLFVPIGSGFTPGARPARSSAQPQP